MKGKETYDVWGMPTDNVEIKGQNHELFLLLFVYFYFKMLYQFISIPYTSSGFTVCITVVD